jgi:hypothetical protein
MIWSNFLARTAILTVAPRGVKRLPRASCAAAPSVWLLPLPTRRRPFSAEELAPENVSAWQALRQERDTRRQQRTLRRRFRRAPVSSLAKLEADVLQLILPP